MADELPVPQPASGVVENLSQADIDRMMAAASASAAGNAVVFRANGERYDPATLPSIDTYDFANPAVIDEAVLRLLRQRHEEFAAFVSARLSILLRLDFTLKLQRVASMAYRRFTAQVPNPGQVLLFKLEPLAGVGVLDINLRLALAVVERLLGGKGQIAQAPQALSEIEQNLLDDVLLVMLEEWCRLWSNDRRLTASIVGHENGGRYLQTSAADTAMLVLVFEATFGECVERIQLALPYASVEGIVRGMTTAHLPAAGESAIKQRASAWRPALGHIPIPLSVEWDACELSLREIIGLQPGTVLRLPKGILQETHVRLGGATKFIGEAGVEDGRIALRIDQKITTEEV
jgi:flagellar motor switch protein FliM